MTQVSNITINSGLVVGPKGDPGATDYNQLTGVPDTFPPGQQFAGFDTRSDLLTFLGATEAAFVDGQTISAGGLIYVYSTGAVTLSDMPDWLPFGDVCHDHWPLTEAGFQAAAAYCASFNLTLNIRPGNWSITQTATTLVNQANLHIRLAHGATLTVTGSSTYHEFLRGANCLIEGGRLNFRLATTGTYLGSFRNADGLNIRNCYINGEIAYSGGYTKLFHLMKFADGTDANDVLVENCTIDTCAFLFLKDNGATAINENVTLRDCTITNAYRACAIINSPKGAARNFNIIDCQFLSHMGESVGDPGYYVGASSVTGMTISGCYFTGTAEQVMHFEENIDGLSISDCVIEVDFPDSVNSAAMVFLTNDNLDEVTISTPSKISITGLTLRNTSGTPYGYGIRAYDNLSTFRRYSVDEFVMTGCVFEGFLYGARINVTPGAGVRVTDNIFADCTYGLWAADLAGGVYDNNVSKGCTYGVVSQDGASFSRHTFINCTNLTGAEATTYLTLHDFKTILPTQDIAAASPVAMKVMDGLTSASRLVGKLHTQVTSDANFTTYRVELEPLNWDGTTLGTPTPDYSAGANCSVAVTQGSDILTQTITVSSDETNCAAVVSFEGFAYLIPPVVA